MRRQRDLAPVAGTCLFYEVVGAGPSLVLIPGFTLDTRMWDAQVGPLAPNHQGIRCDTVLRFLDGL